MIQPRVACRPLLRFVRSESQLAGGRDTRFLAQGRSPRLQRWMVPFHELCAKLTD